MFCWFQIIIQTPCYLIQTFPTLFFFENIFCWNLSKIPLPTISLVILQNTIILCLFIHNVKSCKLGEFSVLTFPFSSHPSPPNAAVAKTTQSHFFQEIVTDIFQYIQKRRSFFNQKVKTIHFVLEEDHQKQMCLNSLGFKLVLFSLISDWARSAV